MSRTTSEPEYCSVPEAAEYLGCSMTWILKMLAAGDLDGFRLNGRAWAVERASLRRSREEYESRDPSHPGRKRSKA